MTKKFCDCCGKEIDGRDYQFRYMVHIGDRQKIGGYVNIVDGHAEPTSGREEAKDLCLPCYNKVMYAAYDRFKEVQKLDNPQF